VTRAPGGDGGWLVVVDPQAIFADPATSPWGSPMWAATVPRIAALAASFGRERTVVTRFVADPSLVRINVTPRTIYTYAQLGILEKRKDSRIIKAFLDVVRKELN